MNIKKIISLLLACVMLLSLAACGADTAESDTTVSEQSGEAESSAVTAADELEGAADSEPLSVVATIFPQYDFVREITGDNVDLSMLLPPGSESHSYEPTPQDIISIQECDVFIYVGGESDDWVDQILDALDTSDMEIIALLDLVEAVEEEIVEGMEDGHGHSHGNDDFEDDEVEDRDLTDWAGEWQSVYPYLLDGSLDAVMEHKAEEDDDMTADDYYEYYAAGYETDVDTMVITENTMSFYTGDTVAEAEYEYAGYEILTYESGSKGVRYMFEAVGETDAPQYVQFSDHEIGPTVSEHFHIYAGDLGQEALWDQLDNWPTYYPQAYDADDIAEEMIGHEEDHDDEDDDDHDAEDDDHDDEVEYDEHVWTSPVNAQKIVASISETLMELDPNNADIYRENTDTYIEALQQLDADFREVVDNASRHVFIFGDRFPFRYFADEYGLEYYAAFPGCSTETEASAGTVAFLIDKVRDEEIPIVFHIEFSNEKMADTICAETDAEKLLLHSCHNVSTQDIEAGVSYLSLMRQNVINLEEALA